MGRDPSTAFQRPALVFLLLSIAAGPVCAQTPGQKEEDRTLRIPHVDVAPTLADYLDGTPRDDEVHVTAFRQREPGDGVPASQRTDAYLSYDEANLYAVFVARDTDPSQVRATLTRRENFDNDDFVGVILDTFRDRRRAYLFIANPFGVQLDGVTTEGEEDDYSFDALWRSEGQLTPFGYVVFMAIPFKSLRFSNATEQVWGVALARTVPRNNETSFWPYITRRVSGFGQQLGTLEGLRDISPGRNIQFIPYGAFAAARFLNVEPPAYENDLDGRAGGDGKMILKDAFALDLTFNPDFSQVESDEPQVTINQRFEVFFPEKRPFFIENASYFETPIDLFFSRRIVDPQVGARLTGKAGGWAVAALAIDDRAPGGHLEEVSALADNRAAIGVVRVQRDFARQSHLAAMATSRDVGPTANRVVAVDGRWKLTDTWVLTGQAAASYLRPLGEDSAWGSAVAIELDRTARNFGAFLEYEDFSPDFGASLGFVQRTDMRSPSGFARYTWFPEKRALVSIQTSVHASSLWDYSGTLQDWEVSPELSLEFRGPIEIEVERQEAMTRFGGIEFRRHETSALVEAAWLKWLQVSGEFESAQEINFFPAPGLEPFLASEREGSVQLTVKPLASLVVDGTYLFTRLSAREGTPGVIAGASIVDNHIVRARASYQVTRELTLRAIVDYHTVKPNRTLIALENDKGFAADFLLTYLVNPWTALYVGYTDGYTNLEIDPLVPDRLRRTDSAFHSLGRQFFVKTSYLLRF
jgi:hypothetical protein